MMIEQVNYSNTTTAQLIKKYLHDTNFIGLSVHIVHVYDVHA